MGKEATSYFLFKPDDWLSSASITEMTPAQEGAYIRLLCYAWNKPNCALPCNDKALAKLSRLGKRWQTLGPGVKKCFVKQGGGLVNLRLLDEWNRQQRYMKRCVEAGKKGANARWHPNLEKE